MINITKNRLENIFGTYFNNEETYITTFTVKFFEEYDDNDESGYTDGELLEFDYQLFPLAESEIEKFCDTDPSFGLRNEYYISINI